MEFCYLCSYVTNGSSCDEDCQTRIGKDSSVFGRLKSVWKNRHITTTLKLRLCESSVMSTMLYGAELWPLTCCTKEKTGSCTPQVPKMNNGYFMERQRGQGAYTTGEDRSHQKEEKDKMALARSANG